MPFRRALLLSLFAATAAAAQARPAAPVARPVAARPAAPASRAAGQFRAVSLDQRALPATRTVAAQPGYHHWIRLDQSVVTLRPDGRFVASFRYYHRHLRDGTRTPDIPVMSETVRGSWTAQGSRLTFVADPPRNRRQRRAEPVAGTLAGNRLVVTHTVAEGPRNQPRTFRLDFERDAGW